MLLLDGKGGVKRLDGKGHLFVPFPNPSFFNLFQCNQKVHPSPGLWWSSVEERKGETKGQQDFLSWPLFWHLLLAASGAWSRADMSGSGLQPLVPSPGASSALQTWKGPFQRGTGTLSLPAPPCAAGLSHCPAGGAERQCQAWGATSGFDFYAHTHKRVFFSGSNWQLLYWVCKSGNNSWRFSVLSHCRDEF